MIFYSNGYEHWIWDDTRYPPRRVQGFYKKTELELLIQRRETRRSLAEVTISPAIVERPRVPTTIASAPTARRVYAVSSSDSPFSILDPLEMTSVVSAPSACAATSN